MAILNSYVSLPEGRYLLLGMAWYGEKKIAAKLPTKLNEHSRTLNYPSKYLIWPLKTTHFMDDFTFFSYKDWRLK